MEKLNGKLGRENSCEKQFESQDLDMEIQCEDLEEKTFNSYRSRGLEEPPPPPLFFLICTYVS